MPEFGEIWKNCTFNRITVVIAIVMVLIFLPDILRLFPALFRNLGRVKAAKGIEHQLGTARIRNQCAVVLSLPFCAVVDSYGVCRLFFEPGTGWSLISVLVLFYAFVIVRALLHSIILHKGNSESDERLSMRRDIYSVFIILSAVIAVSLTVLVTFRASDEVIRSFIRWETIAFYALAVIRKLQISSSGHSVFTTFLYLCTLELLPLGLIILGIVL